MGKAGDQRSVAAQHGHRTIRLRRDRLVEFLKIAELDGAGDDPEKDAVRPGEAAPDKEAPGAGDTVFDRIADHGLDVPVIAQLAEIAAVRDVERRDRPQTDRLTRSPLALIKPIKSTCGRCFSCSASR